MEIKIHKIQCLYDSRRKKDINTYTPSATNTAGTQRLSDGSKIVGAIRGRDAIYVWTDTALFIMRFVGPPFTFSFQQVGTNCGLIGKNAAVEVDGAAYWMSENGFFRYTGKLESLPCLVEDHVYDDINTIPKQHINVGLNNLFGEIMWFYPNSGSGTVNRMVAYNYLIQVPSDQYGLQEPSLELRGKILLYLVNHMQQNMMQMVQLQ